MTDLLRRDVFPRHCIAVTIPANIDNTINAIYYTLTFQGGIDFTIKIAFDNARGYEAHLELSETNMFDFNQLVSLCNHLYLLFASNRIQICQLFEDVKNARQLAR